MSQDRHQSDNNHSVGRLFRRMTLASVGLDDLGDVGGSSLALMDSADHFARRIVGGVERLGVRAFSSSRYLGERRPVGMSVSTIPVREGREDGARSASDLGRWQYWLDAVLLVLFDEDFEAAEDSSAFRRRYAVASERLGEIRRAGVSLSALEDLSASQRRSLFAGDSLPQSLVSELVASSASSSGGQLSERVLSRRSFEPRMGERAARAKRVSEGILRWQSLVGRVVSGDATASTLAEMRLQMGSFVDMGVVSRDLASRFESFSRRGGSVRDRGLERVVASASSLISESVGGLLRQYEDLEFNARHMGWAYCVIFCRSICLRGRFALIRWAWV